MKTSSTTNEVAADNQTMERRLGAHDPTYQSGYLGCALETHRMKETVRLATPVLAPLLDQFQAFAFRGLSGALIAPLLAVHFNKTLIAVRKLEPTHGFSIVLGDHAATTYLIVDDQISSGTTVRWIHKYIEDWAPGMKCCGFLGINALHHGAYGAFHDFQTLRETYNIDTPPNFKEGAGLSIPDIS
jgi:hypothetical protein